MKYGSLELGELSFAGHRHPIDRVLAAGESVTFKMPASGIPHRMAPEAASAD